MLWELASVPGVCLCVCRGREGELLLCMLSVGVRGEEGVRE